MAGLLSVGSIKNGYEVYKMVSSDEQGGYSVSAFARKDGFNYFLKMYHSPTKLSPKDKQEYFTNRIFKLMGKLGTAKIKNFIAQDKEFFLDEETGRYIKISELLTGKQLEKFLASEPYNNKGLPLDEALKYATLISFAFKNIHEFGITHCDLKPENIFIEERETIGGEKTKSIVIIDFDSAIVDDLPKPGELIGTPGYYSIEHLIHDHVDEKVWPTTESDVFTLGIIFYELFTGQKPFPGRNEDGSLKETALIILNEGIMPEPLYEVNPLIPEELSSIILSMLNADKKNRPSMKDVHAALIDISNKKLIKSSDTSSLSETKTSEKLSASSYLEKELGDFDSTISETNKIIDSVEIKKTDETSLTDKVESNELKIVGKKGEIILDKSKGIPQLNSRYLASIGIETTINAGRIYFDNIDKKWKLNTSKFITGNLFLNNIALEKESTHILKSGDIISLDNVQLVISSVDEEIDKEELKKIQDDISRKSIEEKMKRHIKDAKDLTLRCGEKTIKISTTTTFILSSRNLTDFDLYSIKNLGSISVDMGVWKIYPSKYSENALKINNEPITSPVAIAPGDILTINDKQIEIIY